MYILTQAGTGFTETLPGPFTQSWDMNFADYFELFEVFDYTGDGLDDVVLFDGGPLTGGQLVVYTNQAGKVDLLESVTDGLGAVTQIWQRPISDVGFYAPDNSSSYFFPQRPVNGKIWVVSQYTVSSGEGGFGGFAGVNTYQFFYKGGVEDVWGPGFLGFFLSSNATRRDRHHYRDHLHAKVPWRQGPLSSSRTANIHYDNDAAARRRPASGH